MEKTLADVDFDSRDIADVTRALQDYFLHQSYGDRKNLATPRFILPLLAYLEEMTPDTAPDGQTQLDIAHWKARLKEYKRITEAAPIDNGSVIADEVTGPLLLGWYPGEEDIKMLDAVTPIRIQHTIQAHTDSMDDAWKRLGGDLTKSYGEAIEAAGAATEAATEAAKATSGWLFNPKKQWRLLLIPAAVVAAVGTALGIAGAVKSKVP